MDKLHEALDKALEIAKSDKNNAVCAIIYALKGSMKCGAEELMAVHVTSFTKEMIAALNLKRSADNN